MASALQAQLAAHIVTPRTAARPHTLVQAHQTRLCFASSPALSTANAGRHATARLSPGTHTAVNRRAFRCQAAYASEEQATIPDGYNRYETMLVLRPDMTDEERDVELAKFEAFLNNEECKQISAYVRGIQQLAYPIKGYWDGTYVLYRFAARPKTSQGVQKMLSTPLAGSENNVLRHITFRL